jgi:pilus assembly protein CpaE
MRAFIVSDHDPSSVKVREILLREGHDCPAAHVLSLDLAADHLAQEHPELLVIVLAPDPCRGLAALAELRAAGHGRVMAVGPAGDARLVLQAVRTGAGDYLDEAELESELKAALGRLRVEIGTQVEPARTIALLAPSGGCGSSTLAVNLAAVLAREHKSALLLDMKLETGDLAAMLDLKPTHTIADLCQNAARMDRIMFERSLVRHPSGVHLLASPRVFTDVHHVTPDGVRQVLTLGRNLFPYVVADLDHSFRDEQLQILRQAEVILLVIRLDFNALRHAQRFTDYLHDLGIGAERVRLVVNRYGQPKEVPYAKAEQALSRKIFHYVPDDPKTINLANNNGVPAVLEYPRAKVSRSVARLATGVNGRPARH